MKTLSRATATIALWGWVSSACAATTDTALQAAIASPHRSPVFVARDAVRHPFAELKFFGLKQTDTVIEIWPGGGYWTQILVPYLDGHGHYTAALPPVQKEIAVFTSTYPGVTVTQLGSGHYGLAPKNSADAVLTFRNLHDWMETGETSRMLSSFYAVLKSGGILGVEDHRARPDAPQDPHAVSGYVRQDYAISLIRAAGFEFVGSSEIDANARDKTHWPKGVWTLPPTFALGEKNRAAYAAVGEADNFVLLFRKP